MNSPEPDPNPASPPPASSPPAPSQPRPWYANASYLLTCLAVAGIGFWAGPHLVRWYRSQTQTVALVTGDRVRIDLRGDEPSRGADDALVTIVEFSDFECPFCARATEPLLDAVEDHAEDVRLVFKHFPLPGHRKALPAAHAAWAAMQQGKFWELHDWLYDKRADLTELPAEVERLGLDKEQFIADVQSPEAGEAVNADRLTAGVAGLTSTPSFFVNGHLYRGVLGSRAWSDVLEAELDAAREVEASGVPRAEVYEKLMEDAKKRVSRTGPNRDEGQR
ncbi:MAG: DsbA family protein [Myxococcales bacterium FL481]|nr:MAG: DsbA family protein [Myxococcales bacterium FL481]